MNTWIKYIVLQETQRKEVNLACKKMFELVEHGYNVILSLCLTFKQPYYIVLEIIIRQSICFV